MTYDPTLEVPKEIMDAALKIDQWAKSNGWSNYAIGPISSRFPREAEVYELKDRLLKAERILEHHRFRHCDIPACNCNGYHYSPPLFES